MQCAGVQADTIQGGGGGILPRVSKQQDSIYNGLKIEVQLIASKAVRLWYSYSAKLSRICLCTPNQPQPSGEHQHDYRGAS